VWRIGKVSDLYQQSVPWLGARQRPWRGDRQAGESILHQRPGLVWDADIDPVGLSQKAEIHKLLGWVGPWEITLNAGQFTYADNNEGYIRAANGTDKANDAFLFQGQSIIAFKFNDATRFTVAPGFLTYNAASTASAAAANGTPFISDNGTRGLQLLLFPGDFTTKIAGIKTKFVWDFSYNLDGATRA